ncbi:MAG: hypothetical protein WAL63_02305 [Solirubrobacteraceae bacterium]
MSSDRNGAGPPGANASIQRLVVLGYITAAAMPPIGFVLGLLLALRLTKPNSARGLWIMGVSVIAAIVWLLLLTSGVLDPNSNESTF